MNQAYDIIGDLHGYADALIALLRKMDYEERGGTWRHPERQAIFLGDFIDRGPQQTETVRIARQMVEAGAALAVMGNHELNAIAWYLPDASKPGEFLRPHFSKKHGDKNRKQHAAFLAEVEGNPALHREIIEWFLTLPLWLDLPGLRIVHACWHQRFLEFLETQILPGARLNETLMPDVVREPEDESQKDTPEPSMFKATEALAKGIEIPLPDGFSFKDKDGIQRHRVRVRWWDEQATTYRRAALLEDGLSEQLPELPIPPYARLAQDSTKPVFFGHYWLTGTPKLQFGNVACLDYSVAKGGVLCAYRWGGERTLDAGHLCWVQGRS